MESFVNIVKSYNYFSKVLYLRSLTGFWILPSPNKYSLTGRVNSSYVLYERYSEPCLLSWIQTYSGILTFYSDILSYILAYLEACVILTYSEYHIQNPGIFGTRNIIRTLSRHVLAYSPSSELCHIQNFGMFRTPDIFRILFI